MWVCRLLEFVLGCEVLDGVKRLSMVQSGVSLGEKGLDLEAR